MIQGKSLAPRPGSAHKVGFLDDGSFYADAHVFDEEHGDFAHTWYVRAAECPKIMSLLGTRSPEEALEALSSRFESAYDIATWLADHGVPHVSVDDFEARNDVLTQMPPGPETSSG